MHIVQKTLHYTFSSLGGLHGSGSGGRLLGVLALVLAQSGQAALGATLEDGLAVLVHLQLDNHALLRQDGGMRR